MTDPRFAGQEESKLAKWEIIRKGDDLVIRLPVRRLIELIHAQEYEIVQPTDFVTDLMRSLNRGVLHTELEMLFVAECDHVYDIGATSLMVSAPFSFKC